LEQHRHLFWQTYSGLILTDAVLLREPILRRVAFFLWKSGLQNAIRFAEEILIPPNLYLQYDNKLYNL